MHAKGAACVSAPAKVFVDLNEWPTCIIGSRDYCHAPLGVSSFSFSIQNAWEMTTLVDKIPCRSCTACPPAIVLRLYYLLQTMNSGHL